MRQPTITLLSHADAVLKSKLLLLAAAVAVAAVFGLEYLAIVSLSDPSGP